MSTAGPGVRVIAVGPVLSTEDVADRIGAIADTYSRHDVAGVAVLDGFGARMVVDRGHLVLTDGVGEHRRERRYPKVDHGLRRVVTTNVEGVVSFDALRWCAGAGIAVVILGVNGAQLASSPSGREDARLVRSQALALGTATGLGVVRYLIGAKLTGQAKVLSGRLGEADAAGTIAELAAGLDRADSVDAVRQSEAVAANVYFAAWERAVKVSFARRDLPRVPAHWCAFNGRRSGVNPGTPRSATDPVGALLNYGYRLAEVEAVLACRVLGLNPDLGIMHADMAGRASFALDLIEAARPVVDGHVLDLCAGPRRKREFVEDSRGVVRVMAPLTHALAEAMPAYARALGSVTEHVAGILAATSPYDVTVPSLLTGAKHRAAARQRVATAREVGELPARGPNPGGIAPRGRRRLQPSALPVLPLPTCEGCGEALPAPTGRVRTQRTWCATCLPERRAEIDRPMQVASLDHARAFAAATGTLPAHTPEAQAARAEANARQRAEEQKWAMVAEKCAYDAESDACHDPQWYAEQVAPKLASLTLPAIARATGASTSAASKWRAGRTVPHPRRWAALAELVGAGTPEAVGQ